MNNPMIHNDNFLVDLIDTVVNQQFEYEQNKMQKYFDEKFGGLTEKEIIDILKKARPENFV